ncbi:PTS mannose/fructose/sorbose/N-acetylgalactosamine transporter subunit IIC [Brachybacterium sacelli]|uniref:PTS system mannose-specific IIC component/fructoselysine and glucoselysine-specific PTS system IIC component n=1 Tax=Brachybacterium sacelli TaxID=173364 RepID=A0ABS4WZR8_9MICO|nr:PTS sugar transporter subunit IIC [Brachybacterium sacelli]MBP2381473.1 PTS system mannose-specific IIC component/fructoselysine and glucoselysine-specific PTS system IIC component [Brachybacterium sacelli]
MVTALIIGLIAGIGILDERIFGVTLFGRPLVLSVLVGLTLGEPTQGIIIGAQLELVWMGLAGIGGSTPPDWVTGGVIGTTLAILSGEGVGVALAIAVPVAVLAQSLGVLVRIINLYFAGRADHFASRGDFRGVTLMMWIPPVLFFFSTAIPAFLATLLGARRIDAFMDATPSWIIDGLTVAGNLLPAVGFALLLDILWSRRTAVFFGLGFLIAAYLEVDITGVALVGACLAIIIELYVRREVNGTQDDETQDNLVEGEITYE